MAYPNVIGPGFILPQPLSTIGSRTPDGRDGLAAPVIGPKAVNPSAVATTRSPTPDGTDGLAQPVIGPKAINPSPAIAARSVNWVPIAARPAQVSTTYVDSVAAQEATWALFKIYSSGNGF